MLDTVDTTVDAAPAPVVCWNAATRLAFRCCFLYFGLYVLTTQMLGGFWIVPKLAPPDTGATGWMKGIVTWTAAHVLHVQHQYVTNTTGSGDKTVDWVHAFVLLVFSAAAALVWTAVDRRRANYVSLHNGFHVFLRLATGTTMAGYGMIKAIPLQMGAPTLTRLLEPYGNFSPLGVLWASVGSSFSYERFAGGMELAAAVLLFVPRLSMLGAIVLVADSIQIFTLNMTYDVPVKLFSFHLILMGLVLLAPEARRLANVLVLNRAAGPSTMTPRARRTWLRRSLVAAQIVFGAVSLGSAYVENRSAWTTSGAGAPKPPLYGIWTIDRMEINGVERAPLVTDWGRYRRVVFQNKAAMTFWRMDDTTLGYGATVDPAKKTIALTAGKQSIGTLAYEQPTPETLVLSGDVNGQTLRLETRLFDRSRFLLVSRGFHWVQETPFNR
jgi:hypothetical protein